MIFKPRDLENPMIKGIAYRTLSVEQAASYLLDECDLFESFIHAGYSRSSYEIYETEDRIVMLNNYILRANKLLKP